MKFWCKLPEDGDNAETYRSKVIERKTNRLLRLLVLLRILIKPGMLCSATHLCDLRSEELCTSTNQKQQLYKNPQGIDSRWGIPLDKGYCGLMGWVLYKYPCSTKSEGLCAFSLILNRHGIPPIRCRIFCLPICYPNIKVALLLLCCCCCCCCCLLSHYYCYCYYLVA